jgi:hypothetical protein
MALLAVLVGGPQPAQAAFEIGKNFTGSSTASTEFGSFPPDTMGAVGPNHFVELLNGRYAVYNKTTGALVQGKTQNNFWRDAGLTIGSTFPARSFDPRIVYDKSSGHWFASAAADFESVNSRILVGVSNTSDPTQGWRAFDFDVDASNLREADFDTLGVNQNGVYVAANLFTVDPDSPLDTQVAVLALNKANLIAGAPTGTLFNNIDGFGTGFSPQPVVDYDTGSNPELLYSVFNNDAFLKRAQIVGPGEGNALSVESGFLDLPPFAEAGMAHQPGSDDSIDAGDTRFSSSLVKQNGKIWGVHTVKNGDHAALNWFRLDAGSGDLEEEGIIGDSTNDYYYGSIAVNPVGFVVVGYTRSSDTEFASSYGSTGLFNGTATLFDTPLLLKAGTVAYDQKGTGTENRWGDYSATWVDPINPARFWTIQEWASGPKQWSTQITELIDPVLDAEMVPEPASLALLAVGVLPLLRRRRVPA